MLLPCTSVLVVIYLLSGSFLVGMRAVPRVPLRAAFASPATHIRQTSTTSISSNSFGPIASRALCTSYLSRAPSPQFCLRQSHERAQLATSSKRSFATTSSHLLPARPSTPENNGSDSNPGQSQRRVIKYLLLLGILGVGAVVYSDELKHAYGAARRSGRVGGTLAVCINE